MSVPLTDEQLRGIKDALEAVILAERFSSTYHIATQLLSEVQRLREENERGQKICQDFVTFNERGQAEIARLREGIQRACWFSRDVGTTSTRAGYDAILVTLEPLLAPPTPPA